ncbi:hypothetical protein JCM3766R1_005323 [Sporobolomyces carnicolor]
MTARSSSPFDEQAVAELEAKLARKKEKQRLALLEQARRANSGPRQLVADSPSPRKKRQKLDSTSSSSRPGFFDSTLLGPPPPNPFPTSVFKPESSVSITRKERPESKFASHESALSKSFLEKMQAEQESSKADQLRRQRTLQRSTGFTLSASASSSSSASKGADLQALMKARQGTDMKVKAKVKASADGSTQGGRSRTDDLPRSTKPIVPAMSRPKFDGTRRTSEKGKEKEEEPEVTKRKRNESPTGAGEESDDSLDVTDGPSKVEQRKRRRNKDSTVIEDLEMGPIEFVPPEEDPDFERIEPNSGIKLRERIISHQEVQDLLSDRYHLTPSQIYSLARIDNRRQVHVDVDADFVIIGVLAWKDEIRFLNSNPLAEPRKETSEQAKRRQRFAEKQDPLMKEVLPDDAKPLEDNFGRHTKKQRQQRYIRFELVDLSTAQSAASGTGQLNVMMVEADSVDTGYDEDGNEIPIYKGQSGGAYEKYWKESPGAVVAIINPAFLPFTQGRPHTLKPISADSMVVLGRARDLTFCDAIRKKDGQKCNSWVDARVGTKCQYHIHLAVSRTGVGRAETFGNTASLKQTASISLSKLNNSLKSSHPQVNNKKKPLSLEPSPYFMVQGHNTYVAGGSKLGGGLSGSTRAKTSDLSALTAGGIGLPVSRGSGGFIPGVRDGPVVSEEMKKKEREKLDRERGRRELRELGKRDQGQSIGGEYLRLARLKEKERKKREREKAAKSLDRQSDGAASGEDSSEEEGSEPEDGARNKQKKERRKVFSSEAVRMIGFNPTLRPGDVTKDQEDDVTLRQRLALEGGVRQAIKLSAPSGQRMSGVDIDPETVASKSKKKSKPAPPSASVRHESPSTLRDAASDDDDDDLLIEGAPSKPIKLPVPPPRF